MVNARCEKPAVGARFACGEQPGADARTRRFALGLCTRPRGGRVQADTLEGAGRYMPENWRVSERRHEQCPSRALANTLKGAP